MTLGLFELTEIGQILDGSVLVTVRRSDVSYLALMEYLGVLITWRSSKTECR